MSDFFAPKYTPKGYRLNDDNSIITKTVDSYETVYLSKSVKSGVHQWRFKLLKFAGHTLNIGIWKTHFPIDMDHFLSQKETQYAYQVSHACLTKPDKSGSYTKEGSFGKQCVKGDMIDMTLDLDKFELRFAVNNKDYGVAFKNIEKTAYRAAVAMYKTDDQVQLVSYIDVSALDDKADDVKCNECANLQKETAKLKEKMNGIIKDNEEIINVLQQRIIDLEKDKSSNDNINKKLKEENEDLRRVINDQKKQNEKMQNQMTAQTQKHEILKKGKMEIEEKYNNVNIANIGLQDECKELEMNLAEMTAKYNKLYRKSNIDESNYINWNSDIITDWMINLDAEYEAYEQSLRVNLKDEQVDGALLAELERNDLHRFGIKALKHKIEILKHIQRLTRKQKLAQNNEGNDATLYI